ncbi:MAG: LysR family transcriptional regulator [Aestuariivirga sp.]|uniref:LysR substrate-binding domain-containing protein n=1 Tax=Aestuariivirga sp. TaxID=2650926 RepID=UPI0025C35351|nr:LysR substrate-binding domain-containing protein [Aestuariivirga sp.]MCA3561284.1 LysR family transcriptional regulator [Aestuariivirga sp.]
MRRSEIPSLDDLRAFETIARKGSVRAAAEELALTHGAVSRRAANLAGSLGLTLLEPDGRGLRLTQDGAQLAAAATQAFGLLSRTLQEIRHRQSAPPVLLSCERSLAMRWLIPRLSSFQDRHPEIEVHLSTGGGTLDFARDRIALALRRLDFPLQPDWSVQSLMPERVGPVHQPKLGDAFQKGDYVAIGSTTRPDAWQNWLREHPDAPKPRSMRMLDHHFLVIEAALSGLGVALCPRVLVRQDVNQSRLAAPYGFDPDGTAYGLISPKTAASSAGTAALCAWLFQVAAEDRA